MIKRTIAAGTIATLALAVVTLLVVREISVRPEGTGESSYLQATAESAKKSEFVPPVEKPTAIAAGPNSAVYIAGDNSLVVCDMTGALMERVTLDGTPRSIAVDKAGLVYAGMTDHIAVINLLEGTIDTWATLDESAIITSVATFKNDVFVADAGNRVVLRYDTFGRLPGRIFRML